MRQNRGKKYLRYVGTAAVMLACGVGMLTSNTAEAKKTKNYEYVVKENGKVLIKRYIGKKKKVTVPKKIKGKEVYKLGQTSFTGTKVTSVTVPKSITKAASGAFAKCSKLKQVSMEGVTSIQYITFQNCKNLKNVKLAAKLKKVDGKAFENCEKLISVGDVTVDSVHFEAFKNCKKLNSNITFSEKCKTIGSEAFYGCESMDFTIPNSVTTVESFAFAFCQKLTKITIPKDSQFFASSYAGCQNIKEIDCQDASGKYVFENGILYNKDKTSVEYVLPTYTGNLDFLTKVKSLESYAMTGFNQESVIFPETLTEIGDGILFGAKATDIQWPKNLTVIPRNAFAYTQVKELVLPEGVKDINDGALSFCEKMTKITFPKTFENFYMDTEWTSILRGAKSLEEVVVAEGNERCYSKDGLLFLKNTGKNKDKLMCYPAAKQGKSYTVPKNVELGTYCFDSLKYLRIINIKKSSGVERISNYIIDCENVKISLPKTAIQLPAIEHNTDEPLFTNCKNCKALVKKGSKMVKIFKKYAKEYPDMWAYKVVK